MKCTKEILTLISCCAYWDSWFRIWTQDTTPALSWLSWVQQLMKIYLLITLLNLHSGRYKKQGRLKKNLQNFTKKQSSYSGQVQLKSQKWPWRFHRQLRNRREKCIQLTNNVVSKSVKWRLVRWGMQSGQMTWTVCQTYRRTMMTGSQKRQTTISIIWSRISLHVPL